MYKGLGMQKGAFGVREGEFLDLLRDLYELEEYYNDLKIVIVKKSHYRFYDIYITRKNEVLREIRIYDTGSWEEDFNKKILSRIKTKKIVYDVNFKAKYANTKMLKKCLYVRNIRVYYVEKNNRELRRLIYILSKLIELFKKFPDEKKETINFDFWWNQGNRLSLKNKYLKWLNNIEEKHGLKKTSWYDADSLK